MRLFLCVLLAAFWAVPSLAACLEPGQLYAEINHDKALFETAISEAETIAPVTARLTGLTVPHHLLADHLMAGGFRLASAHEYDRVILLFPDHFQRTKRPFATTTHGFDTLLGPVGTDAQAARTLLATADLVEESCLFDKDHGIRALLPFIRHYLPGARVVPVAMNIRSSRAEWDRLVALLAPMAGENTLVVQSTDFSHYLPHHEARLRDQQTLNILAAGDLDALAGLVQPDHMDSLAATYVQFALQRRAHGAVPVVVASENSQQYAPEFVAETTSYMVVLYAPEPAQIAAPLFGARDYVLAGDVFLGRAMTAALLDELAADRVEEAVLAATGGAPLIVNLEGVLLPDVPAGIDHMVLAMPRELAVSWLKRLNVAGVSLANNHAFDIGPSGYGETVAALREAGIPFAGQGETLLLPGLALVALSDLDTNAARQTDLLTDVLLDRLVREDAETPVVAFVHWGREYEVSPGTREEMLAQEMRRRGAAAIIGAHPHVASRSVRQIGGGDTAMVYSLGNFLFDQSGDKASGALAYLTAFPQGTVFVRQSPLPNLFDLATGRF